LKVFQVLTRNVLGGARAVVEQLLRGLPADEFEQTLVCGAEGAPGDAVVVPELVRDIRPWTDLRALLRLAALFAARRPDVVHAHTYKAGILGCAAARLAGVTASIFTPHGHIFARDARIPGVPRSGWKLEVLRRITQAGQACAGRVTALSAADLRQQLDLGLSPAWKYAVIPNGIDVDRFAAAPKARSFEGAPVVGAVGRFTEEKGHAVLLEAFARFRARRPGARLVLVGYGPLEADLRARAARLGLDGSATFAGVRDSVDVLGAFDLFAQPSLYESQGLAILEAQAAGVPVVATDVGGVRDGVEHGVTGLRVPAGDPGALASALESMAADPATAAAMAERARERVRARHSLQAMLSAYGRLYKASAEGYNPAPCTII
jgi:glycosyltransferase involved in cell wall biosynthesis